jgi:uncharacterized protein with FMN-binding domain
VKRVVAALLGTVAALVALLQFKTHGSPAVAAGGLTDGSLPAGTPTEAPTAPNPDTGTSSAPATSPAVTSAPPSPAAGSRSVAGDPVDTRYGAVQVQLTLSGSRITAVKFLKLEAFDRRSQEINSYAAPILVKETLQAQRAQVDTVSGATYTSDGYEQSVQSALDRAGVR